MCVNGADSERFGVVSGVSQESALGPVLFVIFTNDLPNPLKSSVYFFADDTKIFRVVKDKQDSCILQRDMDKLIDCSDNCLLCFHPDKCKSRTLRDSKDEKFFFTV